MTQGVLILCSFGRRLRRLDRLRGFRIDRLDRFNRINGLLGLIQCSVKERCDLGAAYDAVWRERILAVPVVTPFSYAHSTER